MHLNKHFAGGTTLLLPFFWLLLSATPSAAHPMGNFSINHYAKITVDATSVQVLYLLDFAEIPTYQDVRQYGFTPKNDDPTLVPYLAKQAGRLAAGIAVVDNGRPLPLMCVSQQIMFAEGAGGLPTMKIGLVFRAALPSKSDAASHQLAYADNNYVDHAGWKEVVVATGQGVSILGTTAARTDRSQELTNYSTDLLNSPPQQTSASLGFSVLPASPANRTADSPMDVQHNTHAGREGAVPDALAKRIVQTRPLAVAQPSHREVRSTQPSARFGAGQAVALPMRANAQSTPRSRFTQLISTQEKLSFWVLLSAAFIAAGLGALHALEPGHGKTLVAAYLVGSRGKARHAILLGFMVTAAHTAGVYLLGVIALYASRYIVPEQLYPWMGAISGLTVMGVGILMFLRRLTGEAGDHSHVSGEPHSHWFLSILKPPRPLQSAPAVSKDSGQPISLGQLCALGITGGIVPCPAALVVLLSAFSLHRIGFGLFLITAFSFGLALVLVAVGLTMVYAGRFLSRIGPGGNLQRYLPVLSSGFMVILGLGITISAFSSTSVVRLALVPKDRLLPFLTVILLGLFLGIRHSTDPDHVVAVSTIVSRQGSIRNSAIIGALWGLGHTLTIFLVGSAIIVFGFVIPPRLGLAMEFTVALMLILLGVLNLTGLLTRITERFTPDAAKAPVRSIGDSQGRVHRTVSNLGVYQTFRPFVVGLVHGLAGSAAVALLVLSTIKSPFWATAYLLVFGVGTLVGMMLMTIAMSLPLVYTSKRYVRVGRFITVTSGVVSVAFGLFLVYQIGIVDGLFSARPHWIPS
jgi:high-affinity nickel-transport protein